LMNLRVGSRELGNTIPRGCFQYAIFTGRDSGRIDSHLSWTPLRAVLRVDAAKWRRSRNCFAIRRSALECSRARTPRLDQSTCIALHFPVECPLRRGPTQSNERAFPG